jgi:hypothetical protein
MKHCFSGRGSTRLLLCALALTVAQPLFAFTYTEHCQLSNTALALATRYALQTRDLASSLNALHVERLRLLAAGPCRPGEPQSYGDMVALADYALTPVEYYAYVPNRRTPLVLSEDELPWGSIEAMGKWRLQNLRSAHINEDHFEDRALLSHFIWHEAATHFTAARRQLMNGLLLNAFSDHFLQDFFAPGHIHTPRRRLHDITALGRHDDFNRRGDRFFPSATQDLVPLLTLADSATRVPCARTTEADCLLALQDTGFEAGGDGRLGDMHAQRMFLTLITARSIIDVLRSFAMGTPSSSFRTARWREVEFWEVMRDSVLPDSTIRRVFERFTRSAHAGIAYGEFRSEWGGEVSEIALGLTAGHQSMIAGDGSQAIGFVGIEMAYYRTRGLAGNVPRRRGEASFRQTGAGLGYNLHFGAGKPMHGLALRLILPMTEINTQISAGVTARATEEYLHNVAWGAEARAEMGFGITFLGLAVGHEWQAELMGDRRRWLVTSSVSVAAPLSSIAERFPRVRRPN